MKKQSVNKMLVLLAFLTLPSIGQCAALSASEIESVRAVLRGLNVDEASMSNKDLENLRDQGLTEQSSSEVSMTCDAYPGPNPSKQIMTCGGGSHGSDRDPIRF